jgi:hypothetical protein
VNSSNIPVGKPKSRWEDDVRYDLKKKDETRILLRRPRLYQSCSAIEEEE